MGMSTATRVHVNGHPSHAVPLHKHRSELHQSACFEVLFRCCIQSVPEKLTVFEMK